MSTHERGWGSHQTAPRPLAMVCGCGGGGTTGWCRRHPQLGSGWTSTRKTTPARGRQQGGVTSRALGVTGETATRGWRWRCARTASGLHSLRSCRARRPVCFRARLSVSHFGNSQLASRVRSWCSITDEGGASGRGEPEKARAKRGGPRWGEGWALLNERAGCRVREPASTVASGYNAGRAPDEGKPCGRGPAPKCKTRSLHHRAAGATCVYTCNVMRMRVCTLAPARAAPATRTAHTNENGLKKTNASVEARRESATARHTLTLRAANTRVYRQAVDFCTRTLLLPHRHALSVRRARSARPPSAGPSPVARGCPTATVPIGWCCDRLWRLAGGVLRVSRRLFPLLPAVWTSWSPGRGAKGKTHPRDHAAGKMNDVSGSGVSETRRCNTPGVRIDPLTCRLLRALPPEEDEHKALE